MPSQTAWQVSILFPKTAVDALAILLILLGILVALLSLWPKIRSHALRLSGIGFVLSLALFANTGWTYFAAIFIVATVITELEFLQNLAAIIARHPNYWKYKEKPTTDTTKPPESVDERRTDLAVKNSMELKILNTLWVLQAHHHADLDASITFTIQWPPSKYVDPQHAAYLIAIGKLMEARLLAVVGENQQVTLTLEGLKYCADHYKEFPADRWYFEEVQLDPDKRVRLISKLKSISA
ncbi:MAG: hypothetical protein V1784_08500 [bacterium]